MKKLLASLLSLIFFLPQMLWSAGSCTITVNITIDATSGNFINSVGFASNDTALGAESFSSASCFGVVSRATIEATRDGTSATNFYIEIHANNAGNPAVAAMGTSSPIALSVFPATVSFKCNATSLVAENFNFTAGPTTNPSTTYWAVMTSNGVYDTTNSPRWCGDIAAAHGQTGLHSTTNTSTWGSSPGAGYLILTITQAGGFQLWPLSIF